MELAIENKLRYDNYKDSGVEWLGEIPEHWEVRKLKFLLNGKLKYGANESGIEYNSQLPRYVRITDFSEDGKLTENSKLSLSWDKGGDYLLKDGDILFARSGATVGKSYQFKTTMSIENDYCYAGYLIKAEVNSNMILSDFLYLYTVSDLFRKWKDSIYIKATIENIGADKYSQLAVILPSLPEQQAIANFLDDKCSKIDAAVEIKQKQIALLKERRQISIHQAVTRGLDKNVPLKDSGVEWIGEIPEHWEVKRLKFILNGRLKYGANESGIEYSSHLPRYVRITDFGDTGKLSEDNKLSLSWEKGKEYLLKDGDILFARSGATVGKSYQFKKSMSIEDYYCYAGYLIKAEVNEDVVLSDFLYLYTLSDLFRKWRDSIFIKATIENIGADKYSQLSVILPSINEQREILSQYKFFSSKIDTAISIKQQEIEKLKEYKTSLINSAVTGKIKVLGVN